VADYQPFSAVRKPGRHCAVGDRSGRYDWPDPRGG